MPAGATLKLIHARPAGGLALRRAPGWGAAFAWRGPNASAELRSEIELSAVRFAGRSDVTCGSSPCSDGAGVRTYTAMGTIRGRLGAPDRVHAFLGAGLGGVFVEVGNEPDVAALASALVAGVTVPAGPVYVTLEARQVAAATTRGAHLRSQLSWFPVSVGVSRRRTRPGR